MDNDDTRFDNLDITPGEPDIPEVPQPARPAFQDDLGSDETLEVAREPRWWVVPLLIVPILLLVALIAAAVDNTNSDDVSSAAATTVATSTSTSTTRFTPATTTFVGPVASITTASTASTATTAVSATTIATTTANPPMTITASWNPEPAQVGEQVAFDVRVIDKDAGPITECGGSPPGGFGDSAYAPGCQAACSGTSTRQRSEASFRYLHTYSAPGTYTVKFSYQSAGGCTSQNPQASQATLTFRIQVTN